MIEFNAQNIEAMIDIFMTIIGLVAAFMAWQEIKKAEAFLAEKSLFVISRKFFDSLIHRFKSFAMMNSIQETSIHDDFNVRYFDHVFYHVEKEINQSVLAFWETNKFNSTLVTSQFVIDTIYRQAIERLDRAFVPNLDQFKHHVYFSIADEVNKYEFPQSATEDFVLSAYA